MAITNGYCTLAQFRQRFGITTNDDARDTDFELLIQAASRRIDRHCNRVFYAGTAGTVRYYTAESTERCYIDDCDTATALVTDDDGDGTYENTWAATDYVLLPVDSLYGWPFTYIEIAEYGDYTFPRHVRNGVKLTGTFGWAAVPDEVREACLLLANRWWQRRAAPFGVAGANEFGAPVIVTKMDPDVIDLLTSYVRYP